jgi:preprotein translocase subunit SecF
MEFFHKKTRYPFMGTRRRWYLVSAVLIVAALVSFTFRGLNLGIDFTGGRGARARIPADGRPRESAQHDRESRFHACGRAEFRQLA